MNQLPHLPELAPPPASISVTEPVSRAIEHTRRVLFPFNAGKWLTLGFVAWLAHLGEGGGSSFNLPDTSGRGSGGSGPGLGPALDWLRDNLSMVVTVGVVVLLLGIALGVAMTWVSSRAKLMFVHSVARDEAKVEEPWRRFAERGRDLFWVRLWIGLLGLGLLVVALAIAGVLAWPDLSRGVFESGALLGLLLGGAVLVLGGLPLTVAAMLIDDFVVPTMYLNDEPVGPAWRRVKSEVISGRVWTVVLFYLMKFLLGLVTGLIALVATCITCCIVALPYIGTVFLLPLFVFNQAYVLYFLEQFGSGWQSISRPEAVEPGSGFSGP
ncbi:MAG: hypothetical protein IPM35_21495 [Myxococcales bacterium]|nr:hypothetical protein [Myxococcales bacterium]